MSHLPAAHRQSDLQAELLIKEVDRLIEFCFIIMLINIDMKLDLFDLLRGGVLALCLEILFLLIAQFAEIHDPDHRRIGRIGNQYEILPRLQCQLLGTDIRDHPQLTSIGTDQTHLIELDAAIIGFQQLGDKNTLLSNGTLILTIFQKNSLNCLFFHT